MGMRRYWGRVQCKVRAQGAKWWAGLLLLVGFLPVRIQAEGLNNKAGIHILDAGEIGKAAELVNSNGGDWGYVTVPIQADDKDRKKWQQFMDEVARLHVIPIVRIATYPQGEVWAKPNLATVLDFANFLTELNWPVKKRYVVIFNEVNRASEWGGEVNPAEYAQVLSWAQEIFLKRDENFVVLPAGLDAAAPNVAGQMMDEYQFLRKMYQAEPAVFSRLQGWAAHAYPNPDFSGQPGENHRMSIVSYKYELNYVRRLGAGRNLPVFITETGWRKGLISEEQAGKFYKRAFEGPWQDEQVVAITPFLLFAGDGSFVKFSFLDKNLQDTGASLAWKEIKKVAGNPELERKEEEVALTLSATTSFAEASADRPEGQAGAGTEEKVEIETPVGENGFWEKLEGFVGMYVKLIPNWDGNKGGG